MKMSGRRMKRWKNERENRHKVLAMGFEAYLFCIDYERSSDLSVDEGLEPSYA